jgi:hypothetical protein
MFLVLLLDDTKVQKVSMLGVKKQKKVSRLGVRVKNKMLVMLFFYVQYVCIFSKLLTRTFAKMG